MSATVSAFGHRGTTSSVKTEIVRELVNASDGAGLNLQNLGYFGWTNTSATNLGTSDFSIEFILNQTGDNTQDNYIWFSNFTGDNRVYFYNDIDANVIRLFFHNSSGSASGTTFSLNYDMSADYGTPTHYILTVDRSGDATLYKNGNSVASETVSAASAIDLGNGNTNAARIGSSSDGYSVLGTFYRLRVFNTLVDAKLLFERADVPRTLTANLKIDLDLAFANPSQSLTIQNRAGAPDGSASSSTLVTQVQPIIQGNMRSLAVTTTSQAAGVPADGDLLVGGTVVAQRVGIESSHGSFKLYNNANTYLNGLTTLNGLATCNSGIAFGSQTNTSATGAAVATDGTTLDHYEEGTWTPVHVTSASTSGTWNTTLTGHYTRVGDLVTVNLKITGTTMDFSSVDGYRGYSGLPFAPALDGCAGSYDTFHAASTKGTCAAFSSGSSLYLYPSKIGTGTTVIFATVTYKV